MRILIHTDEYWPTCKACAYRMKVFTDVFREKGNEVIIVTSSVNKVAGYEEKCEEKIIYAPTIRMKKKTTIMRMLNNLSFAITSIFAAIKAGKIDVVITTSPPPLISISGWVIAKIKRAKLVYDVRDIWPDVALEMGSFSEGSFFCKVFRMITNFMYEHADIVTTVSPGKVEKIKGKLKKSAPDKVKMVANGFDESVIENEIDETVKNQYNLDKNFTCVYIGNIGLAQGLDTLLDLASMETNKEIQFLIFGDGAEKEKLELKAKNEGLSNVRFCGTLEHEKVFTILSNTQISYIPLKSSNMKDSIPTKVYEALGIGCPVLLLAEGDACDLVKETGLGLCVSPDKLEDLPKAFEELVTQNASYMEQRSKAKQIMLEKYSRQKIAVEFEKMLCEITH